MIIIGTTIILVYHYDVAVCNVGMILLLVLFLRFAINSGKVNIILYIIRSVGNVTGAVISLSDLFDRWSRISFMYFLLVFGVGFLFNDSNCRFR